MREKGNESWNRNDDFVPNYLGSGTTIAVYSVRGGWLEGTVQLEGVKSHWRKTMNIEIRPRETAVRGRRVRKQG
jgi:hypothetical protein